MTNKKSSTPIFIPQEVKKIVELNKGIGKNELGKSLIDLLEDSPKYRKLKEIINRIVQELEPENVSFEDILSSNSPQTKKNNSDIPNENYLETRNIAGEETKSGNMPVGVDNQSGDYIQINSHPNISNPIRKTSLDDNIQTNCPLGETTEDFDVDNTQKEENNSSESTI